MSTQSVEPARRDIRGGLAWTLAVDVLGTAALAVAAMVMSDAGDPAADYYKALALVGSSGAALAVLSVTTALVTLRRRIPSRRMLLTSVAAAALGLAVNTAGVVLVLAMPRLGHTGAAMMLLLIGDSLGIIYLGLLHRALVTSRLTTEEALVTED